MIKNVTECAPESPAGKRIFWRTIYSPESFCVTAPAVSSDRLGRAAPAAAARAAEQKPGYRRKAWL
jgi:hypothetical protein